MKKITSVSLDEEKHHQLTKVRYDKQYPYIFFTKITYQWDRCMCWNVSSPMLKRFFKYHHQWYQIFFFCLHHRASSRLYVNENVSFSFLNKWMKWMRKQISRKKEHTFLNKKKRELAWLMIDWCFYSPIKHHHRSSRFLCFFYTHL